MCGICGFTGGDEAQLRCMLATIVHRGPDSRGIHVDPQVSIGTQRLSIVDIAATQPVYNETKMVVAVMNGELYNHTSLRESLESMGHVFTSSHNDTEIIPHMYEQYGVDWVGHVNGMFAIAIWDKLNNSIHLFRDRLGKKPLYYSLVDNNIVFGSELKAVVSHRSVGTDLDNTTLHNYFLYKNSIAPRTIYKDVQQLPPGSFLTFNLSSGEASIQKYWKTVFGSRELDSDFIEEFMELLHDSVTIRTKCDVPFGAYLSGGLDSSSIVSILSRVQPSKNLKTFCLGYKTKQLKNKEQDIKFAREIAEKYSTDHYEVYIDHNDFVASLEDIVYALDEPFSGTISNYFVSSLIAQHVKVALSGDGADELFGSYLKIRLAHALQTHQMPLHDMGVFLALLSSRKPWEECFLVFSPEEVRTLLNDKSVAAPQITNFLQSKDPVNFALREDQNNLLHNQVLVFVDRLSMAHSVEVRSPYLDYRLVDLINTLSGKHKVYNSETKIAQKLALKSLLPNSLINREKEGFVQPIYFWMKNALKNWTIDRLNELPRDIINTSIIKNLSFDKDLAKLWNLVCFSLWYNTHRK